MSHSSDPQVTTCARSSFPLLTVAEPSIQNASSGAQSSTYEVGELSRHEGGNRHQVLPCLQWARACRRCTRRCFVWTSSNPNSQSGFSLHRLAVAYLVYILFGSVIFKLLSEKHWNWTQSIYYAMTVGLAIGYGAMEPRAPGCRIFAIIYVILGACALSLLLSVFVRKLMMLVPKIAAEELHYQAKLRDASPSSGRISVSAKVAPRYWLPITLWLALSVWILLGTIWAREWQHADGVFIQWSWLTSLLFAVGTVTTAGMLGPEVNSDGRVPTKTAAFLAVYAFIGVPLFGAAVSHAASKYMEHNVRRQQRAVLKNRVSPAMLAAVRELRRGTAAESRCHDTRQATRPSGLRADGEAAGEGEESETVRWGDYLALELLRLHKVDFELIKDVRKEYLKAATRAGRRLSWSMLDRELAVGQTEDGEQDQQQHRMLLHTEQQTELSTVTGASFNR